MNNICGKCNKELSEGTVFCPYCGEKIIKDTPTSDSMGESTFWKLKSRYYPKASNDRRFWSFYFVRFV